MGDMVERVARAMMDQKRTARIQEIEASRNTDHPISSPGPFDGMEYLRPSSEWDKEPQYVRDRLLGLARAAINAMSTPTDEMTAAGAHEIWHETYPHHMDPEPGKEDRRIALNLWTAMIEKSGGAA